MKKIFFIVFLVISIGCKAQNVNMFIDSLIRADSSIWIKDDGTSFTKIGELCVHSSEFIFYKKDKKITVYDCRSGNWVEIKGTWNLIKQNNLFYVEIYDSSNALFKKLEIQIIGDGKNWSTRLNEQLTSTRDINFYSLKRQ